MLDIVLLLGPIAFTDFEVPAGITFGGAQRLAIHRLPGGTRIVDTLGRDDAALTFEGIFTGSEATLRARAVDELRAIGLPLPLTWDVFFYSVVIDRFQANYQNSHWIPYRIRCTVIRDEAAALIETAISPTVAALGDVGTALAAAAAAGIDLSAAQSSLADQGAGRSGTAAFAATQSSIVGAQSALNAGFNASEGSLLNVNPGGASNANAGIAALSQTVNAASQLSHITQARAYLGRAASNLANAST